MPTKKITTGKVAFGKGKAERTRVTRNIMFPCWKCKKPVQAVTDRCPSCGAASLAEKMQEVFGDPAFVGQMAGMADRAQGRPRGETATEWKEVIKPQEGSSEDPESQETLLRPFESAYERGWNMDAFNELMADMVEGMSDAHVEGVPDELRRIIKESLKGQDWAELFKGTQPIPSLCRMLGMPVPDPEEQERMRAKRHDGFATLFTEVIDKAYESVKLSKPALEQAVDYMLSSEDSRDGYFVKDLSNSYVYVNSAMGSLLECSDVELLGKTDRDLYSAAEAQILQEAFEKAVKGEMLIHEQSRVVGGRLKRFREVFVPKRSQDGEVVGVYGISRELPHIVTDYKQVRTADCPYPSEAMRRTMALCLLVAPKPSAVLLLGESGSGKDYLARYIHQRSGRSGPFRATNCAAIPETLAESELFGHERGAFTGATQKRIGFFESANEGTAFINEIGELSLPLQAKLFTFLDDKIVQRIGGTRDIPVDVRIIAATNKDLKKAVAEGSFRQDLFYRLNVFSVQVPPLRERMEDLLVLINELTAKLSKELNLTSIPGISAEAMHKLYSYAWPGNVRELRNVLEKALIVFSGGEITANDIKFPDEPAALSEEPGVTTISVKGSEFHGLEISDEDLALLYEQVCVVETQHGKRLGKKGSMHIIAEVLGISRETVSRKLSKMGCPVTDVGRPSEPRRNRLIEDVKKWLRANGRVPTRS
jgi:PAS domain S-box-containing protein